MLPVDRSRKSYLDGLRGLSIVPVVLGHTFGGDALPAPLSIALDAHSGVRVFFVVSGYIITRLLLEERLVARSVRLAAFYGRRFAKLLPALWLYLLVLAIIGAFSDVSYTGRQLVEATVLATGLMPEGSWYPGHVWSLTVEEVFYLSWAPLLGRVAPSRAVAIAAATVAAAFVVRGLNAAATSNHFAATFAGWPQIPVVHELDSIAIGCLCALWWDPISDAISSLTTGGRRALILGAAAFALFFGSSAYRVLTMPKPLQWALGLAQPTILALTVATVLTWAAVENEAGRRTLLDFKPLTFLGRASYSIYVVQQGFCVPVQWRSPSLFQQPPFNLALTLATGIALFLFVEQPARRALVKRFGIQRPASGYGSDAP